MGLLTVFYAPEKLFAEVGKTKGWLLPFVAAVLLVAVMTGLTVNMIDMGAVTRTQIESNSFLASRMTQAQIDQAVANADTPAAKIRSIIFGTVGAAIVTLILAGILFGLAQITDAGAGFKNVLAVVAYSGFAYGLVSGLGGIIALKMMGDTSGVDVYNLIKLNPTLFMDKTTASKMLYSLASSLDLLSFWRIFLLGLGLSKISLKMTLGKGLMIAIIPWVVYVLGKMGLAAIF